MEKIFPFHWAEIGVFISGKFQGLPALADKLFSMTRLKPNT
jgi:hypothetical protein